MSAQYSSSGGARLTGDVSDQRIPSHRIRHVGQTNYELNHLWIQSTSPQTSFDPADKPPRRPSDLFRTLDYDGITGEERSKNRRDEVVERVVP